MKFKTKSNKAVPVRVVSGVYPGMGNKPSPPEPPTVTIPSKHLSGIENLKLGGRHQFAVDGEVTGLGSGRDSYDDKGEGTHAKIKIHSMKRITKSGGYESAAEEAKESMKGK